MVVQKWPFFQLFLLGNKEQKNVFYDILERKNAFLNYKNKKFIKSKTWHFSREVNPWFSSKKWPFYYIFVFRHYKPRKCLLRYFRTKKRLSRLSNKKFKKSKNWHFSKWVKTWFWSKNGHFQDFLFYPI